jgi:hypothetical protein
MKKIVVLSVLSLFIVGIPQSRASILYSDNFNSFSDGNLVGQGSWTAHSGAGSIPVLVSGGAISLNQGSGSREDVNVPVGATMGVGDTWYYAFDATVSGGSTAVYFAMFMQGTSNFEGKLFIEPFTGYDFTFGISGGSETVVNWGSGLTFGTDYRVVVSFNYDTKFSQLWVNPVSMASPSISTTGNFQNAATAFAFRQAAGNSSQVIDNLVVATSFQEAFTGVAVPEPSTFALAIAGGLACLAALRRKQ